MMLRNTFCHLPGIGPKTEQGLWNSGVHCWEDALARALPDKPLAGRCRLNHVEESMQHLEQRNAPYFAAKLPKNQAWRLFNEFRKSCAYLDIETTGLGGYGDHVTSIAVYDGSQVRTYVYGINLNDFVDDVRDYELIITYNGATFDLPFLQRQFNVRFQQAHIDLRYVLSSLGLKGGLKQCEKQLGMQRQGMEDLDGYAAVLLWREYQRRKDSSALETLLAYNVEDTINLEVLMIEAYNRNISKTPFIATHVVPDAPATKNPYKPDAEMVKKVRRSMGWRVPYYT